MSTLRKLQPNEISTCRRKIPLWEGMERILNELLRSISITSRKGRISVALDDDKVWLSVKNSKMADLFNLRYASHVRANRKGIILHTAVSTGPNLPLCVALERKKDSSSDCLIRILDFLFSQDGSTNLENVSIHSDRGYMIPSVVFEYVLPNGGDVVGTVKRMVQCWPFTFKQTLKPSDKRTVIDTKGASTLFLKFLKTPTKYLFASAFRNGTDAVATAVSSLHSQHHWEGIALYPSELREYKEDVTSLLPSFFQRVKNLKDEDGKMLDEESEDAKDLMNEILGERIVPYSLRQGKCTVYQHWLHLITHAAQLHPDNLFSAKNDA